MFKPLTLVAVGLSLALSGAALAKEKIDFMFPAPVDGKLTMEMTRVIKQFNDSQQDVEVRGIFTGNYDTTKIKAESAQKAGQPPALNFLSLSFSNNIVRRPCRCDEDIRIFSVIYKVIELNSFTIKSLC